MMGSSTLLRPYWEYWTVETFVFENGIVHSRQVSLNETRRLGEEASAGECHGLIILSCSGLKLVAQNQDLLSQLAGNVVSLSAHVIAIGMLYSLVYTLNLIQWECAGPPCGRVNYLADCPAGWALDLTLQKCQPPLEYQVRQPVHQAFATVMLVDSSPGTLQCTILQIYIS